MISIIGAGPSGTYLGSLIKDKVRIYEEHKIIGKPIQCTGILTHSIKELTPLSDEFIVNKIKRIKLISPNNNEYEFKLKNEEIIVDREKFDNYLINKAKDNGAEILTNHKLKDFQVKDKIELDFGNKKENTEILVGADGPNSLIAKKIGLKKDFKIGHQYVVKGDYDPELFTVYFNGVKSYFCWVVPENNKLARIGIVGDSNIPKLFDEFLNKINIDKKNFIECQSGVIPVYNHKAKYCKNNVYVIGDAAGHVKATTLGGIVYGMRGAKILAGVLNSGNGDYSKLIKKNIGKDLWLHNKAFNFLSSFGEKGFDDFVKVLRKVNLGEFNRDNPFSGLKLFMRPELIYFLSKQFIRNGMLRN